MKATFVIVFAALFVASVFGDGKVKCPPVDDVDVTILPNPDDCKTFYICNAGIPFLMSCPAGQEFNAELRVCDLPEQANCVPLGHKPTTSPKPSTTSPKPSTTSPKPSTTSRKPSPSSPEPTSSTPKLDTSTPPSETTTAKPPKQDCAA